MRVVIAIIILVQTCTVISVAYLYRPADRLNSLLKPSESEQRLYERYEKPATLDTIITEIQRASFCQNLVIPMVDLWKENKDKKNASLREKLGPELWARCSNYVWSPVVLSGKR